MSPFSSVLRTSMWGGLPISLLALAVFAYLIFRSVEFSLRSSVTRKETLYLMAATGFPLAMSLIYGFISLSYVGTICKLCAGIYTASAAGFVLALLAHRKAMPQHGLSAANREYGIWFGEGVLFVAVLTILYVAAAPSEDKNLGGCGTLVKKQDPAKILLNIGGNSQGKTSLAVIDPLCAACSAFDKRLGQSGLLDRLNLHALLMPLDSSCNWMVEESVHPGACAISEAMLCDRENAAQILAYAFEHREALLAEGKEDERRLRQRLQSQFPSVKGCLGTATIRNKLNKSLRWAVANALPVLTPQLFIGERRLCDEDTDLGLEYTVASMLNNPAPASAARR